MAKNPTCSHVLGTNVLPSYTQQKSLFFFFFLQIAFMAVIKDCSSPVLWFPCCRCGSVLPAGMLPIARSLFQSTAVPPLRSQPAVNARCWIRSNVQGLKVRFLCISKFLMANAFFFLNTGSPERRETCSGKSPCSGPRSPLVFPLCSGSTLLSHWN